MSWDITGSWLCDYATVTRTSCTPSVEYALDPDPQDTTITIPATGWVTKQIVFYDLPDFVCSGSLEISISTYCQKVGGGPLSEGHGGYFGTLFLVDETPTGWMSTPWVEVLQRSCTWADGKYGRPDVLKFCTKGLYGSGMFTYDRFGAHHVIINPASTNKGKFFLSTIGADPLADCRDVSSYLELCTSALGQDLTLSQVYTAGVPSFRSNLEKPIGSSSYGTIPWWFHQVALDGNGVYDACAAQWFDLDAQPYYDVPVNWPKNDYWQKHWDDKWVGLVNGLTSNPQPQLLDPLWGPPYNLGPLPTGSRATMLTGVR